MSEEWKVTGLCPQCGGEVLLEAGNPLLYCPFCRTNLHMTTDGPLCYMIPPWNGPRGSGEDIVYVPYWRFRGMHYRVIGRNRIEAAILDTTTGACTGLPVEASLGIRPQAGVLRLVSDTWHMIPHDRPERDAIEHIYRRLHTLYDHRDPGIERFVGERKCLVYAPFRMDTTKGAPGKACRLAPLRDRDIRDTWRSLSDEAVTRIREGFMRVMAPDYVFLPLICPECGSDLPALSGAVVYPCCSCSRVWKVSGRRLTPMEYCLCHPPVRITAPFFLPFWRLSMSIDGMPLENRAQLFRLVLPYKTTPAGWDDQPATLFIPAFRLNPRLFLKAARWMSLANMVEGSTTALDENTRLHVASFPVEEAAKAVKIVLAELFKGNARLFGMIKGCRLKVHNALLVFLPFERQARELVDAFSGHAISEAALALGRW